MLSSRPSRGLVRTIAECCCRPISSWIGAWPPRLRQSGINNGQWHLPLKATGGVVDLELVNQLRDQDA